MDSSRPKTAVILQPSYFPWLGYFAQVERCDVFVVYDDVQYDKNSWRNRNRIKSPEGAQWLTVPVLTKGKQWPTNREAEVNNAMNWPRKQLNALRLNYTRAPYFDAYYPALETLLSASRPRLLDLNLDAFRLLLGWLGLDREIVFASELGIPGSGPLRLIEICRHLSADRFYEGAAGRDYIDPEHFQQAEIELVYQDYQHPVYPQLHGDFIPYLSALDLLFNCGPDSLSILAEAGVSD